MKTSIRSAQTIQQKQTLQIGLLAILVNRTQLLMLSLGLMLLFSALGIIYVTNATRTLTAGIQRLTVEQHELEVQWGQLLLERSTWSMPARIQRLAATQLDMEFPNNKSVVILKE